MKNPVLLILLQASLLALCPAAGRAQDTTLLSTDFEPPIKVGPFAAGQGLHTQDSHWGILALGRGVDVPAVATVQTEVVRSGSQALQINSAVGHRVHIGVSTAVENNARLITFECDVYLRSGHRPSIWQIGVGDASVGGFAGGFNVLPDGHLKLMGRGFPESQPVFKRDAWTHCVLCFNIDAQTCDVFIDGVALAQRAPFTAKAQQLRLFQLATFSTGDDTGFLDNVLIHTGATPVGGAAKSTSQPR